MFSVFLSLNPKHLLFLHKILQNGRFKPTTVERTIEN